MATASPLRAQFPVLARLAYLNAGAGGPVPSRAVAAARAELERQAVEGRASVHWARRRELQAAQRAAYARLLACDETDVALTTSTTEGVGLALAAFELGRGDEVVTSDEEHPGLLRPLHALRDLSGVELRAVPFAEVAGAVGAATRLVACSHVSWVTGAVAPPGLAEVAVPVMLDGAQGLGAVAVDVGALGCDAYAGSGQKWLCGPDGSGMLYLSQAIRDRLAATARGHRDFEDSDARLDPQREDETRRFDAPSLPAEGAALALESLAVLGERGWDSVHARARGLAATLADELRARGNEVSDRGDTTLVSWSCEDAEQERARLAEQGIVVRDLPGRDLLRASVGAWNDESDLERLLDALRR